MVTMATHIVILMDVGEGAVGTFKFNHIVADTYQSYTHILPN